MQDVVLRREVLKLNKLHHAVGFFTPKKVFGDLANYKVDRRKEYLLDSRGKLIRKMLAYDITYHQNEDGSYDFNKLMDMRLVDWDEWITLPIRSYDLVVKTPKLTVRIPRVVLSLMSEDMPQTKFNNSLNSYYELYGGECAYTKRKLKKSEASRDHQIPLSRGGKNDPTNVVLCHKDINSKKGNKYNHECGLPEVVPLIPKQMPLKDVLKNEKDIPEWNWFLSPRRKH